MRCCVPFCKSTTESVSISEWITYHGFPTDPCPRAVWLKALGYQASHLPDCAVVCSLHFLHEDIYKSENGSIQVSSVAVPRPVQFCIMCLDTDSKLLSVKKHKLEKAYKSLTGYTMCEDGNLRQTLCVVCAHRLNNFSRFREQSLRAHTLMVDCVSRHELVTIRDMKMIKHSHNHLKSNIVKMVMEPDHYDLYIHEYDNEDKQTAAVKEEVNDISLVFEEEHEINKVTKSDEKDTQLNENVQRMVEAVSVKEERDFDPLAVDTGCSENNLQIKQENEYNNDKRNVFIANGEDVSDNNIRSQTELVDEAMAEIMLRQTARAKEQGAKVQELWKHEDDSLYADVGNRDTMSHIDDDSNTRDPLALRTNATAAVCVSSLVRKHAHTTQRRGDCFATYLQTRVAPSPSKLVTDNENKAPPTGDGDADEDTERALHTDHDDSEDEASAGGKDTDTRGSTAGHGYHLRRTKNPVPILGETLATIQISNPVSIGRQSEPAISEHYNTTGTLAPVLKKTNVKNSNVSQTERDCLNFEQCETSSETRCRFICDVCKHIFISKGVLVKHMKLHTNETSFACKLCQYKCKSKKVFVNHLKVHTCKKIFSCHVCGYKHAYKSNFTLHMRTHTGEKPFFCTLCEFKCTQKNNLIQHMRLHTCEKPFFCKLCEYKCTQKSNLVKHIRTHTGEKPYSCKLCKFKSAQSSKLTIHMRVHTGEKPFSCNLCDFKCTQKTHLVPHMRVHTGEKPISCNQCEYKCASKRTLNNHIMRFHPA